MAKSAMTRAATLKCLEEKLRYTLDQLKTQENLNAQLLREREESELEMKHVLDRLSKMKSELKEQHMELLDTTDHRDTLQRLLEEGDQCRLVHNESLYEIEDLRRVLDQAQSKIISLEQQLCNYKLDSTLQSYNAMIKHKDVNSKFQSRKQLKKFLRLSRSMCKNSKLLKKYRVSVNTLRQSNLRLKDDLISNNELLLNTIGSYEQEAQVFQEKIVVLESKLERISQDYSLAQAELSDHTTAMSQLVDMCNENEQRFNSLLNNYSCNNCLEMQQNIPNNNNIPKYKSTPSSSVIFSDEIGRGLGSTLNWFSKDRITNLCFPNMSYCELYLQMIKNYDICNKKVVLMCGSSHNVDKVDILNLFDWIGRIHSNKLPTQLTLVTFPYFRNVNNQENALIYEKNCLLLHLSKSFDFVQVIDLNSFINKSFMTRDRSTSIAIRSRYILAKLLACNFNYVLPCKTNFFNIKVSTITNNVPDKDYCPPLDVCKSICSQLGNDKDYCPLVKGGEDFCPQPRCVYRDIDISKVKSSLNF